jgi:hypothetical protein
MKTQFTIFSEYNLPNGKLLLAGHVIGSPLTPGQHGRSVSELADEVEIEIISLGLIDPLVAKPGVQAVQAKLVRGTTRSLNGATLNFD